MYELVAKMSSIFVTVWETSSFSQIYTSAGDQFELKVLKGDKVNFQPKTQKNTQV